MKHYVLFDGRYTNDPDSAIVYDVCDTLEEAQESKRESFTDAVIVEETVEEFDVNQYRVLESTVIN